MMKASSPPPSLLEVYQNSVIANEIHDDAIQRKVLASFQRLSDVLRAEKKRWLPKRQKLIQGIYLFGPVGRGKTFLMDLFCRATPLLPKQRLHYHHFMQQVDAELRRLQGQKDPLKLIAKHIARTARVLCLDEFMVHDIADAMILAELLKALFNQGVVLVATSNIPPEALYLKGLQRARFLPAIDLIKQHCQVLNLAHSQDYRLGKTQSLSAYLYPCDEASRRLFTQQFMDIAKNATESARICIQNRFITCVKDSDGAVWFEFDEICSLPRSQLDYIEISKRYKTIFVSGVPCFKPQQTTQALLFCHFIDVMYDQKRCVILLADGPVDAVYPEGNMSDRFKRTISRLKEMQSEDYMRAYFRAC